MTEVGVVLEKFWLGMALHLWQTTLILAVLLILGLGLRRAPARYSNTLGWLALFKLLLPLSLLGGLGLIPFGAPGGVAGPLVLTEYVRVVLEPSALAKPVDGGLESEVYPYIALTVAWLFGIGLLLRRQRSAVPETMVRLPAVRPEIRGPS